MDKSSRRVAIKIAVTAFLAAGVYFFAAGKMRQPIEIDAGCREVMGTFARIVVVAKHEWQGKRCIEAGFEQLKRIDAMMSRLLNLTCQGPRLPNETST